MFKKIATFSLLVFCLSFSFLISTQIVNADATCGEAFKCKADGLPYSNSDGTLCSDKTANDCLPNSAIVKKSSNADTGTVSLQNPLCPAGKPDCVTPQSFIGRVINALLGVVGSVALLMFIYGGFLWMTSQGNEKQVQTGKDILLWAAIGMALIFLSYALVRFLITDVIQAS